ncbi:hypothetical protein C8Q76DRAFT_380837 [Earliella scabrosa]|nr:hypothetical protein C8Q76DRAFT_380837 [Earliella scabrosa]
MTTAPYSGPLDILCKALCSTTIPLTETARRMIEEIRDHWSSIVKRIWFEPSYSLDAKPKAFRVSERILVPEIASRMSMLDPTFLDVLLYQPRDFTLAVIFRNWMHSTDALDSRTNMTLLCDLLDSNSRPEWQTYLDRRPLPPAAQLLPRMLIGVNKFPSLGVVAEGVNVEVVEAILLSGVRARSHQSSSPLGNSGAFNPSRSS